MSIDVAAFVLARLAEHERAARDAKYASPDLLHEHFALHDPEWVLAVVTALRAIVEFHESWPVLVETEPEFTTDTTDPTATTLSMAKRMAWLTEREYRERFGVEPPTAPIMRALARIWADHPDYDPAWA